MGWGEGYVSVLELQKFIPYDYAEKKIQRQLVNAVVTGSFLFLYEIVSTAYNGKLISHSSFL